MRVNNKLSIWAALILFSAGSLCGLGIILSRCDAFDFLYEMVYSNLNRSLLITRALLFASAFILIMFNKDKLSYIATSMLLIGNIIPGFIILSLIGSPSNERVIITFVIYAAFVVCALFFAIRDIMRLKASC